MSPPPTTETDVIVLGAGAAGLMCALTAGVRGRSVVVLERAERPGKKILVSGGGRCNFTNLHATADNYLSGQPDFCRSALARYTPQDFLGLVEAHGVAYHEKKLGQLFCDGSSREIVDLLLAECRDAGARVLTGQDAQAVARGADGGGFTVDTARGRFRAGALVVAAGGVSWPKLGGSDVAYRLARQFGLRIVPPRPGLVPLTFQGETLDLCTELSGVALPCAGRAQGARAFHENLLFTHRGLSGPAVLQISSYLPPGDPAAEVTFDLLPDAPPDEDWLAGAHRRGQEAHLASVLSERLPTRVAQAFARPLGEARPLRQHSPKALASLERRLRRWSLHPGGTEGYAKAEVTLGGVDTRDLHGKTMESRQVPGLFFVGEAVDVTGQLGGFNFQWAWASGHAAGQAA